MADDAPPTIEPAHTALLVMDYQPAILASLGEPDALLSRAADAIALLRHHGGHVGYVRVAFEDADYDAFPPTSGMGARVAALGKALHSESPTSAIHDHVAPEDGDIIVRKTRVGAFSTTDLDRQLRDRGIATLILAGISTSGVVLSTVRDAYDRDYQIFVLADVCADPQADIHDFLIERVLPRQAHVISATQLEGMLAEA